MDEVTHNAIVWFIRGIRDDGLHDLLKRGKYPDVTLPLCVWRRMHAMDGRNFRRDLHAC